MFNDIDTPCICKKHHPVFYNILKCLQILRRFYVKRERILNFRPVVSKTLITKTNLINSWGIRETPIRKIPTGKIPTHQTPPWKIPTRNIPTQKIPTWNITTHAFKYFHPSFYIFCFFSYLSKPFIRITTAKGVTTVEGIETMFCLLSFLITFTKQPINLDWKFKNDWTKRLQKVPRKINVSLSLAK